MNFGSLARVKSGEYFTKDSLLNKQELKYYFSAVETKLFVLTAFLEPPKKDIRKEGRETIFLCPLPFRKATVS